MRLSRRDFLKTSITVSGLFLLGRPALAGFIQNPKAASSRPVEKAMLYDASKCIGCRSCEVACKRVNGLPSKPSDHGTSYNPEELSGITWTVIKCVEFNDNGENEQLYRKCQCMHCAEANCEAVCPTGAISHEGEAVVINQEWCIGCGYCVQVCPFCVPHICEEVGTARKCSLCIDRTTQGLKPACVEACPKQAVIYGDRADLIDEGKRRVQALIANGTENANFYGDTELGGLGVTYVLLESPSIYGLPEAPRLATANAVSKWLSGIITAGVIVTVPFWLLFKRREGLKQEEDKILGE
jgi:formate dehydrogenase iron-sulfur subunit